MHYHMELVLPDGGDLQERVSQVMARFRESDGEEEDNGYPSFHDYYLIGGRWSGDKLEDRAPEGAVDAFYERLKSEGVTVSGLRFGKQTIMPESQIHIVDRLWREMVPGCGDVCPIFDHYKGDLLDVCKVSDISETLKCATFGVAQAIYTEGYEMVTLQHSSIWNGVDHQDTAFDGFVKKAIEDHNSRLIDRASKERAECLTVTDDWLCVTIDYHT